MPVRTQVPQLAVHPPQTSRFRPRTSSVRAHANLANGVHRSVNWGVTGTWAMCVKWKQKRDEWGAGGAPRRFRTVRCFLMLEQTLTWRRRSIHPSAAQSEEIWQFFLVRNNDGVPQTLAIIIIHWMFSFVKWQNVHTTSGATFERLQRKHSARKLFPHSTSLALPQLVRARPRRHIGGRICEWMRNVLCHFTMQQSRCDPMIGFFLANNYVSRRCAGRIHQFPLSHVCMHAHGPMPCRADQRDSTAFWSFGGGVGRIPSRQVWLCVCVPFNQCLLKTERIAIPCVCACRNGIKYMRTWSPLREKSKGRVRQREIERSRDRQSEKYKNMHGNPIFVWTPRASWHKCAH